jgi:hypothetical protein
LISRITFQQLVKGGSNIFVVTLSCALLLYGVVAAGVVFLVVSIAILCARAYLFGSWLDLFGRNLSKKGWLGFSQDKFLCPLVLVTVALIFSIYANMKEDLNIGKPNCSV